MSELSHVNNNETSQITRSGFLLGVGALLVLELSGCARSTDNELLPREEVRTSLPKVEGSVFNSNPHEFMDTEYLSQLLTILLSEISEKETKVGAVQKSLRRIKDLTNGTEATAFQIDKSGYYLTAKHTLPDSLTGHFVTVVNPYDGEESLVTECRVHDTADIAVVFAPNGKQARPTVGLQLDFSYLEDKHELWMIGLYTNKNEELFRYINYGQVDRGVELSYSNYSEEARVAVRGMIPFGGTSGSPIVNSLGTIVGIESGYFPEHAQVLEKYVGAVITPLSYVQNC